MITHVESVMGTVASVTAEPGDLNEGEIAAAVSAACRRLHEADAMFSTFRSESALMRHRRGELASEQMPAEFFEVLRLSAVSVRLTAGAFDPWALPGGFDPTGLVKGWAAQRAVEELRDAGVAAAMVNAGGDIACYGPAPWRIGVRDPSDAGRLACVAEVDAAIATSGDYERPGELIDPRCGQPLSRLAQASVVGPDLALADALATALLIRGEEMLASLSGSPFEALVVTPDGRMLASAGFPVAAAVPARA